LPPTKFEAQDPKNYFYSIMHLGLTRS